MTLQSSHRGTKESVTERAEPPVVTALDPGGR